MGIKRIHDHDDGGSCYRIRAPRSPQTQHTSRLYEPQLINMAGHTFAVARWSYTTRWLAFDIETGKEIENFTNDFFEKFIKPYSAAPIIKKPDCVPPQVARASSSAS